MNINQNHYKINKMKQINNYIQEKLKLNKSVINKNQCTLFPKDRKELVEMIENEIEKNGNECSLNHIDVSNIKNMSNLFSDFYNLNEFNGDISKWNVSNITNMFGMFFSSIFDGDISNWDVSKVKNMKSMFSCSKFNSDISNWDVSKVTNMESMFYSSNFNSDISKWNVSKVKTTSTMFALSNFNQDISSWKINPSYKSLDMFYNCPIKEEYKPKSLKKIK